MELMVPLRGRGSHLGLTGLGFQARGLYDMLGGPGDLVSRS